MKLGKRQKSKPFKGLLSNGSIGIIERAMCARNFSLKNPCCGVSLEPQGYPNEQ